MANSLKKDLEETYFFPKGEVPFHSFAIKGLIVLFDELTTRKHVHNVLEYAAEAHKILIKA